MNIRPFDFTDTDYEARAAMGIAVYPDYKDTVEELKFGDAQKDPKLKIARFFAEVDGQLVGQSSYSQSMDMYHPQKFELGVAVLPEWQGKGIGKALYAHLLDTLTPHEPILVRAHAREDHLRGVRFATERGFTEAMRDWESRFDPQAFDRGPFVGALEKVVQSGIVLKSLAELRDSDPDWQQKLYELDWTITLDMPTPDTLTEPGFEHFAKNVFANPNFLPEAWFIALEGDQYVGESALWNSVGEPGVCYVGATGVRREYRRRGIATALKLTVADWAKAAQVRQIRTWNAQENRAMLSINEAMGFEKIPAWISYEKKLIDDNSSL